MEDRVYKPGERIAHYEVLQYIGGGGFSAVYKARDLKDAPEAAPAAVKISRFDFRTVPRATRTEHNARLWREQDALAQLDHQNIVRATEWGLHEGKVWYSMELLPGPTLGRYLAAEPRSWLELMLTYRQLLEAVAHCHENGVIHRDLKPSNIIVTPEIGPVVRKDDEDFSGRDRRTPSERLKARLVVLIDFGLGHLVGAPPVTAPGVLVGTAEYLPPWYVRAVLAGKGKGAGAYKAEPVDDVYQLGVLLYAMLTGRLPTRTPGEDVARLLEEIRDTVPVHPRELNPDAPEALSALAMRCLEKQSTKPPPDAAALRREWLEAMHRDGEALRLKAPVFQAGEEATLRRTDVAHGAEEDLPAPAVAGTGEGASVTGAAGPDTVSAPAHVLAEAAQLVPGPEELGTSRPEGTASAGRPTGAPVVEPAGRGAQPRRAASWRREAAARLLVRGNLALRRGLRRALVATALVLLGCLGLAVRLHYAAERVEEKVARLEEREEKVTQALTDLTHAQWLEANARAMVGAMPPAGSTPTLNQAMRGGLKMPDKPDPHWLRPDKDGVCRNPRTGEELRTQAVIRATCWRVVGDKLPGESSCPSDLYDPPPEVLRDMKLKRFHEHCFSPWTLEPASSMEPQP